MRTEFGKFIVGGTKIGPHINFSIDPKRVFLTISNPNYVGSFIALALPIIAQLSVVELEYLFGELLI